MGPTQNGRVEAVARTSPHMVLETMVGGRFMHPVGERLLARSPQQQAYLLSGVSDKGEKKRKRQRAHHRKNAETRCRASIRYSVHRRGCNHLDKVNRASRSYLLPTEKAPFGYQARAEPNVGRGLDANPPQLLASRSVQQ